MCNSVPVPKVWVLRWIDDCQGVSPLTRPLCWPGSQGVLCLEVRVLCFALQYRLVLYICNFEFEFVLCMGVQD